MRIESLKYRTEDKNDVIIIVNFYNDYKNPCWQIADIKYKTSRQREYRYYSYTFRDSWEYRRLDLDERREYALNKYEEFVGKEKLQEAVMIAWEMIKPDINNIEVGNI